jgi:hypothetical protein
MFIAVCQPACLNGGSCTAPGVCTCTSSYTGPLCNRRKFIWMQLPFSNYFWCLNIIAVCDPSCKNGATCSQDLRCHCAPGWTGEVCDQGTFSACYDISPVLINSLSIAVCQPPCANGGNCTQPGYCSCPSEWEGARCETRTLVLSTSSFISFYSSCMQLDVPQNVRMVETAMSLETVSAPLGGQAIDVN